MARHRSVNTYHSKIFEYWSDKYITKLGKVISSYQEGAIPAINDKASPSCCACGGLVEEIPDDIVKPVDLWSHQKTRHELNRCHITPACCGGEDKPENLFLMCENCHKLSPDTTNREAFFRWVYKQRKEHTYGEKQLFVIWGDVERELKDREMPDLISMLKNIPKENTQKFNESLNEFPEYLHKNIGYHPGSNNHYHNMVVIAADFLTQKCQEFQNPAKTLSNE